MATLRAVRWLVSAGFVVAWSSGFVGATLADRTHTPPLALLGWRYLLTAVVLACWCSATPRVRDVLRTMRGRDFVEQTVLGVLSHVVFLGGVFLAAQRGLDAGVSALVCALQPMVVAAASTRLFGDRLRLPQWAGLTLALVGVGLVVGGIESSGLVAVGLVFASLLALCTAAMLERAWASQVPVSVALLIQVSAGSVIFTIAALFTSGLGVNPSMTFIASMLWLVLLSGLAGYATFVWCLRRVGATATSTLLYLTAPVTMLWAWLMFGQQPAALQWLGVAVVMGGVALTLKPDRQRWADARTTARR